MDVPVITLWQPWASWVALGWKTIETRTHDRLKSLIGKWVGIHAGLKWDDDALRLACDYMARWQIKQTEHFLKMGGAIICLAHVSEARWLSRADEAGAMIECATPRYGLVFDEVKQMEAVPAKGKQGIWYYPDFYFPE